MRGTLVAKGLSMGRDPEHEDGRRKEAAPQSLSGRLVAGRYAIVGLLGVGGIGRVYEAEQVGLDRSVAIKVIRPERRDDEVTVHRFMREARAAGRISSPHVVTLYDCGRDDTGELYIAMELLEGRSLSQRIASREPFEMSEVLQIATMIALGLRAAHEAGVLHRDLKPANVFLCDDGNVKVLDFGIAKLLDDEASEDLTAVNRILGTPVYMSPEAATRRPLGPTSDLYALGLLIFEMVVGTPPFKTGDAWKTLEKQVKTRAPRLESAAPWRSIPDELGELVASLLKKNPLNRPRDAGEVAERLRRISTELAMQESLEGGRTDVDVPMPPAGSGELEDDELEGATTLWSGATRVERTVVPAETLRHRALSTAKLDAHLAAMKKKPTLAHLTRRQLFLAATVGGAIAFSAMLLFRLIFG